MRSTPRDRQAEPIAPSNGSALVAVASTLTARQMKMLGVSDLQLRFADLLFQVCVLLIDDRDDRPLLNRLDDIEDLVERLDEDGLTDVIAAWSDNGPEVPPWMRRALDPGFQRFLRRFVGAGRFHRLKVALQSDGACVLVAVRRGLRYLLPIAAATDRCIRTLSPDQRSQIDGLDELSSSSMLELAVTLDAALSKWLDGDLLFDPGVARPDELQSLPGGMGEIARSMSERVTGETALLIQELNSTLARKVQGARDALRYSSDPVSQGANSVIELVDRLLRDAFDPRYVMDWTTKWFPGRDGLTYSPGDGSLAPTKRAQALCFVFAGGDVDEHCLVQELAAASITSVRQNLQQLKHSDTGSEQEQAALLEWIVAIESTLLLVCKFAWLGADEANLTGLRHRLSPPEAGRPAAGQGASCQ